MFMAFIISAFMTFGKINELIPSRVSGQGYKIGPVCVCVCVGLLRVHYTPLQRYITLHYIYCVFKVPGIYNTIFCDTVQILK